RGDGKGNGGDGIGSGGESKAACLAIDASIDSDMGGSSLTVFRALRRRGPPRDPPLDPLLDPPLDPPLDPLQDQSLSCSLGMQR
nr:hypothetical protein [Tanacetum cinerariifolium]